ncbi:MAG TPA: penicillin acylase family protein, partial [Fibrella sp.]
MNPSVSRSVSLLVSLIFLLSANSVNGQAFTNADIARWQQRARQVTITRDTWGVPHIYGKTDADVVFGLLFTQCEDDFGRVEENYITSIGRLAEIEGEAALYHDLRARLFMDSTQAIAIYKKSPVWMKHLLDAFAD